MRHHTIDKAAILSTLTDVDDCSEELTTHLPIENCELWLADPDISAALADRLNPEEEHFSPTLDMYLHSKAKFMQYMPPNLVALHCLHGIEDHEKMLLSFAQLGNTHAIRQLQIHTTEKLTATARSVPSHAMHLVFVSELKSIWLDYNRQIRTRVTSTNMQAFRRIINSLPSEAGAVAPEETLRALGTIQWKVEGNTPSHRAQKAIVQATRPTEHQLAQRLITYHNTSDPYYTPLIQHLSSKFPRVNVLRQLLDQNQKAIIQALHQHADSATRQLMLAFSYQHLTTDPNNGDATCMIAWLMMNCEHDESTWIELPILIQQMLRQVRAGHFPEHNDNLIIACQIVTHHLIIADEEGNSSQADEAISQILAIITRINPSEINSEQQHHILRAISMLMRIISEESFDSAAAIALSLQANTLLSKVTADEHANEVKNLREQLLALAARRGSDEAFKQLYPSRTEEVLISALGKGYDDLCINHLKTKSIGYIFIASSYTDARDKKLSKYRQKHFYSSVISNARSRSQQQKHFLILAVCEFNKGDEKFNSQVALDKAKTILRIANNDFAKKRANKYLSLAARMGNMEAFRLLYPETPGVDKLKELADIEVHRGAIRQLREIAISDSEHAASARAALTDFYSGDSLYSQPGYAARWAGLAVDNDHAEDSDLVQLRQRSRLSLLFRSNATTRAHAKRSFLILQTKYHMMNCGLTGRPFTVDHDTAGETKAETHNATAYNTDNATKLELNCFGAFIRSEHALAKAHQARCIQVEAELHDDTIVTGSHPGFSFMDRLRQGECVSISTGWEGHAINLSFKMVGNKMYMAYCNRGQSRADMASGLHFYQIYNSKPLEDPLFLQRLRETECTRSYIESLKNSGDSPGLGKDLQLRKIGCIRKSPQKGGNCALAAAHNKILVALTFHELEAKNPGDDLLFIDQFRTAYNTVKPLYKAYRDYSRQLSNRVLLKLCQAHSGPALPEATYIALCQQMITHAIHKFMFQAPRRRDYLQPLINSLESLEAPQPALYARLKPLLAMARLAQLSANTDIIDQVAAFTVDETPSTTPATAAM